MDYSIPWDLLPDDDADFLDRLEIQRGSSFIKFKRELTREELALLCTRLWNFRSIVPDPKESHVNFAIGEAFNEFSKRFGKKEGEHFIKQFVRLSKLRDNTLKLTGGTLVYLQMVEHLIKGCCAMLKLKDLQFTLEDFQSKDLNRRRQTLGQLKRALTGTFDFTDQFEDQFNRFVRDRNEFVHTFWVGDVELDERVGLPSENHYNEKLKFTIELLRQAYKIERIFRGLFGSIGKAFPEAAKKVETLLRWEKYVAEFKDVLRQPDTNE